MPASSKPVTKPSSMAATTSGPQKLLVPLASGWGFAGSQSFWNARWTSSPLCRISTACPPFDAEYSIAALIASGANGLGSDGGVDSSTTVGAGWVGAGAWAGAVLAVSFVADAQPIASVRRQTNESVGVP